MKVNMLDVYLVLAQLKSPFWHCMNKKTNHWVLSKYDFQLR